MAKVRTRLGEGWEHDIDHCPTCQDLMKEQGYTHEELAAEIAEFTDLGEPIH